MTIRKQILRSLITHLENTDWIQAQGIKVNPGKMLYIVNNQVNELPGISVFAATETAEKDSIGRQDCLMQVEIKYVGVINRDAIGEKSVTFEMIEDVRGRLIDTVVNASLDGLADPPEYTGGDIDYPDSDEQAFTVSVDFTVRYETLLRNPYSQGE